MDTPPMVLTYPWYWKTSLAFGGGQMFLMVWLGSLVLADNLPRDGVLIKILAVVQSLIH